MLLDPQVVAVLGYDSQAPAGQAPLPGQTIGGPVHRDETLPMNPDAIASTEPALGLDDNGQPTAKAPPAPAPRKAAKGPVQAAPPRQQAARSALTRDAVGMTDIGTGGTPGEPPSLKTKQPQPKPTGGKDGYATGAGTGTKGGGLQYGPEPKDLVEVDRATTQ